MTVWTAPRGIGTDVLRARRRRHRSHAPCGRHRDQRERIDGGDLAAHRRGRTAAADRRISLHDGSTVTLPVSARPEMRRQRELCPADPARRARGRAADDRPRGDLAIAASCHNHRHKPRTAPSRSSSARHVEDRGRPHQARPAHAQPGRPEAAGQGPHVEGQAHDHRERPHPVHPDDRLQDQAGQEAPLTQTPQDPAPECREHALPDRLAAAGQVRGAEGQADHHSEGPQGVQPDDHLQSQAPEQAQHGRQLTGSRAAGPGAPHPSRPARPRRSTQHRDRGSHDDRAGSAYTRRHECRSRHRRRRPSRISPTGGAADARCDPLGSKHKGREAATSTRASTPLQCRCLSRFATWPLLVWRRREQPPGLGQLRASPGAASGQSSVSDRNITFRPT